MKCTSLLRICCIFIVLVQSSICSSLQSPGWRNEEPEGRYTGNIDDYHVLTPSKVNHDGEFLSYSLPHFYEHDPSRRRKRSLTDDSEKVHYGLTFNGKDHHLELWPNHDLISPGMVVEERSHGASLDINKVKIRPINTTQCHYTGRVKGQDDSRLAISVCDGLSGHIMTDQGHYFIEPMKNHQPQADGRHLHVVHKRSASTNKTCGTGGWEEGWFERLRWESQRKRTAKRTIESKHRYLKLLVVADKRFLEYHNTTDMETYILTIMNMASDNYHDASAGNLMDIVLVRIIYLYNEKEEIDLFINQDADSTLPSFCDWQIKMNPRDLMHPNHHDIAVLLTRHDLCSDNMTNCDLLGLAYMAQACNPNKSCAICEDNGLLLGVTVTHEVGHVMGSGHDDGVETECEPYADDANAYIMSPYVQMAIAGWSTCSKKSMQELLDNDLGECLLDEPQDHTFKFTEMPPGAMYDADFQCAQQFNQTDAAFCDMGPEKNCKSLYCWRKSDECSSYGEPPADGTRCAANMWCYNRKCVQTGKRPEASNGEWGEWMPWSECSRTCGGGVSFTQRDCNNPTPQHHGRYCLGERRRYRICNTHPCEPGSATFRQQQCRQYNDTDHHWDPILGTPQDACRLLCKNEAGIVEEKSPRVKDGTPCKPGTKDVCITGMCRAVGCDWILDSDNVDDQCGVCGGDGTECTIIEETFTGKGRGYVKIATIPTGSRKISIQELQPTGNTLALKAEDDKNFYLNGDFSEENDRELNIAGTVGYYFHPEHDLEKIVIAGPTTSKIVVYACFFGDPNPGITYKYAVSSRNHTTTYVPTYHWESVDWNECSRRCGGGTQQSEPKCIEERDGEVSNSFCRLTDKPKALSRPCNQRPCKALWKVGEWGECEGCLLKTEGHRSRSVECTRESPYQDSVIITDETDCTQQKPRTKDVCNCVKMTTL